MPSLEAPCVELGSAPQESVVASPSPSEISSASSPEPQSIRATPLFRALAMPPPEPEQPRGQDELERRLPGYQRIVIPRELTLIELLKQCSGVSSDDEVLQIREARLRVVAERVGLRRLNILAPRLRSLTLDGSALASLRDLGIGLVHLKVEFYQCSALSGTLFSTDVSLGGLTHCFSAVDRQATSTAQVLSVNRCGLTSLDGVWGLSALRELSAAGNRLQDLHPLAALQKLHTLNLSDNPILEPGRLWTLGICSSLRRLTLTGSAAAGAPHYRAQVATSLPMLVYLDDRPLHTDVEYDSDGQFGMALLSDSGESDEEQEPALGLDQMPPAEPEPGPSSDMQWDLPSSPGRTPEDSGDGILSSIEARSLRRRPATTEGAGVRPTRPHVPSRPRTAIDRPVVNAPTKLQILNTLMDEEWRCSGSELTSQTAVCGNLAQALRRSNSSFQRRSLDAEKELVEATLEDASRALASEIPRAPKSEDWIKFKQDTGIDIDIVFKQRPPCDAAKAIERLEQIEKETLERFKQGEPSHSCAQNSTTNFTSIMNDFETWKLENVAADDFSLFSDLSAQERNEFSDNESRSG